MRQTSLFVLACCSLILLASPLLAAEAKGGAEGPIAPLFAPASCGALAIGTPEPLFMTCTVQIECSDSSVISCSGDSCSTSGTNNRCVTCNGVQQSCCSATCCEVCRTNRDNCQGSCPDQHPLPCINACNNAYNNCVAGCTGGCS